jgi:N-hydroxyarylamine O-acetyltransferase
MEAVDWSLAAAPTHRPLSPAELTAYCARINWAVPPEPAPSAGALRSLVRAHALAIPFESFDVTLRVPIDISPRGIFAKLVSARRGGFCLETSFLLLAALQTLGFEVRLRAARVWMRAAAYTPREPPMARLHVVLVVRAAAGEEWLCDVGFGGGGPPEPLPLRAGAAAAACGDVFRVDAGDAAAGEDTFVLFGVQAGAWRRLYSFEHAGFDAGPLVHAADFLHVSHFVQAARNSLFHTMCVASLPLPEGRVTLLGRELRRKGAEREGAAAAVDVARIADAGEYRAAAARHFGIQLSEGEAGALFEWARAREEGAEGRS